MATPRQTPHRSKREVKEVRQSEVAEFRSENQRLRRENARLRREVEKYQSAWGTNTTGESEAPMEVAPPVENGRSSGPGEKCRACGSHNVARVKIAGKTLVGCRDCKDRFTE